MFRMRRRPDVWRLARPAAACAVLVAACVLTMQPAVAQALAVAARTPPEAEAKQHAPNLSARAIVESCLAVAAAHHAVDAGLLRAIATVESGLDPAALNRANADGSRDIGLMQINSAWLPALARWRITENDLFDPCVSAYVGAWILAGNIARLGLTWRAVGAYNARTPSRQLAYVRRVQRQLTRQAHAWDEASARAP